MRWLIQSTLALLLASISGYGADSTTIAILDLKSTTVDTNLLIPLANRLSSEIVKTGAFTVVERGEMAAILKEQGFQQGGCTDANCAVQAGQLLNVHFIIAGTVDKLGNIYSINVRMVNVATGQIAKSISDDCVDCSIDDFVMKTVRRAALKLVGQDVADESDEKVSDALKVQHFLYKGNRTGKLGSITFDVKPIQSRVIFDDSSYGAGKILIENVPAKKHHYEVVPENRRFMPGYGTVRIAQGEIAEVGIALRKSYFNISASYSYALFDGKFSMPADSFSLSTIEVRDPSGTITDSARTRPIPNAIQNSGTVPATVIAAVLGIETRNSYYSIVLHMPFGNVFTLPDRYNDDRDRTGVNHGNLTFGGDTLYYSTYVTSTYASYFSYIRKILNLRDVLMVGAGLNAGVGITQMAVDFYKFQSSGGHTFYNYNKDEIGNESTSPFGLGGGSAEFGLQNSDGVSKSFLKLRQLDFGGPVFTASVGAPKDRARFFIHYMMSLGITGAESENVVREDFSLAHEFKAGWIFRF